MRFAFGDCVFDSGTHEVLRANRATALSPKAFALLNLLIDRRPDAVSRADIHQRLWPGTFVSDASLANLVAEVRDAIGDDGRRPRVIRTVHRFGYAFSAPAALAPSRRAGAPTSSLVCRLLWDGREIHLFGGENVIGREEDAAVWIDDSAVSRRHARIVVDPHGATLEDLASKNGTYHSGERVCGAVRLADRDEIRIGPARLVFRAYRHAASTATAEGDAPRR